ncbi:hypothetical protein NPIL_100881 [Nephila pilipes]|uniref:Uncharacterized protein n=1 Tax=Nephila pilipes TaxID=299642 RepID=A0A8X6NDL6_NEPPI|nr:hypothetical protein NPIL_100881 [Nephila pilipes]
MLRKNVFKTAEEAIEYLFSEELESEMFVLPPEVDKFTDEEGFDDSETLDPSVRDVICPIIFVWEQKHNQVIKNKREVLSVQKLPYPPSILFIGQ